MNTPTTRDRKRGTLVFAGLIVASLVVNRAWTNSGAVMPPAVPGGDSYEMAVYRNMTNQGDAGAMYLLGRGYLDGRIAPKEFVEAHKWLNLAVSRGSTENYELYTHYRRDAARPLTPQQIADAHKRARDWWAAFERQTR